MCCVINGVSSYVRSSFFGELLRPLCYSVSLMLILFSVHEIGCRELFVRNSRLQ